MVLARFNQALERYKGEIGQSQYWRYRGGRLPQLLLWLVQRPDLVQALADDARALAEEKGGDVAAAQAA